MRTTAFEGRGRWGRSGLLVVPILLAASLTSPSAARAVAAVVIDVPAQFATIQGAIDVASTGDTVLVASGTYREHINFKGKAIEVRSVSGPASTTIQGDDTWHTVSFRTGEGRASVLRGFTITHDPLLPAPLSGGGVLAYDTSPTVVGNVITANDDVQFSGAGITVAGGSALIQDNQIVDNHSVVNGRGGGIFATGEAEIVGNLIEGNSAAGGGGVMITAGTVRLTDNVIRGNSATTHHGGGVKVEFGGTPVLRQNLIVGNTSTIKGGGVAWEEAGTAPRILGNTIVANEAPQGSALMGRFEDPVVANNVVVGSGGSTVACDGPVDPGSFHHNNVFSGTTSSYDGCPALTGSDGNISADPLFVVATGPTPDYRLQPDSSSIDAGDSAAAAVLPTDLGGLPRVTDGDGAAVVDMGAHEAPAMAPKSQRMPYTVWNQPTGVPLDGLGGWVFPVNEPAAAAGQLPPNYLYAQYFSFVGASAVGQVGLVVNPEGRFATFGVVEPDGTAHNASVPFEWTANRFYFPIVHQVGPGSWGAWVYDDAAATWTAIGTLTLPAGWGSWRRRA